MRARNEASSSFDGGQRRPALLSGGNEAPREALTANGAEEERGQRGRKHEKSEREGGGKGAPRRLFSCFGRSLNWQTLAPFTSLLSLPAYSYSTYDHLSTSALVDRTRKCNNYGVLRGFRRESGFLAASSSSTPSRD